MPTGMSSRDGEITHLEARDLRRSGEPSRVEAHPRGGGWDRVRDSNGRGRLKDLRPKPPPQAPQRMNWDQQLVVENPGGRAHVGVPIRPGVPVARAEASRPAPAQTSSPPPPQQASVVPDMQYPDPEEWVDGMAPSEQAARAVEDYRNGVHNPLHDQQHGQPFSYVDYDFDDHDGPAGGYVSYDYEGGRAGRHEGVLAHGQGFWQQRGRSGYSDTATQLATGALSTVAWCASQFLHAGSQVVRGAVREYQRSQNPRCPPSYGQGHLVPGHGMHPGMQHSGNEYPSWVYASEGPPGRVIHPSEYIEFNERGY
ncbi:hypothetical protein MCOR25_006767 [Pyricularia grisea]|nr:hypothetical protein MCOR25_006767 [Pyricularia grisea]